MKRVITFILMLILFGQVMVYAGDDFQWEPVTESDWNITPDISKINKDAVMIFEKIIADDQKLFDEKCYYIIYRRIKIFNNEGREWGDVTLPYLKKSQKIEKIMGRTILPDGTIIPLNESQIYEKEVFKSKELKVKQKSFYLPAVSDNCIIEYYVKYRLKSPRNNWIIEKDIYLKKGEFVWKFYRGEGLSDLHFSLISEHVTPNYLWVNTQRPLKVEQRPSLKNPEEVVFSIEDIDAFDPEPYTLPDNVLKANLYAYYGGSGAPGAYWGDLSKSRLDNLEGFTKKNDRVKETDEEFQNLSDKSEKIKAAYEWIQKNLKNIDYEDDKEKFDDNESADDVIKHGYGTGREINMTFCDMLRELNIDAKMAYATDRDDALFEKKAKYWQFSRSFIAIQNEMGGTYQFYNPSLKFLEMGSLPWYNEGVEIFLTGEINQQFCNSNFSESKQNMVKRNISFSMDKNFQLTGSAYETHRGHSARDLRLNLSEEKPREQNNYLMNFVESNFDGFKPDSFQIQNIEDIQKPLTIKYNVRCSAPWDKSGNKIIIHPVDFFSQHENAFHADNRKFPIMFDYAKEITESIQIELPEGWKIAALPAEENFGNSVGFCQFRAESLNEGHKISIQKRFILNYPFFRTSSYNKVQDFFMANQKLKNFAVIIEEEIL